MPSLQLSSVTVDSVPVTGWTVVDRDTVAFDLPPGAMTEGEHTVEIAAGAIVDLQGTPIQAFRSTYGLDLTSPRVIDSSIQQDDALAPGNLTVTVVFDEELAGSGIDPANILLVGDRSGSTPPAEVPDAMMPMT